MATGFTRVIQWLWIFFIGLSLLVKLYDMGFEHGGELSMLAVLIAAAISLPLSAVVFSILIMLDIVGTRPWGLDSWLAQWSIMAALGYAQWFMIVPRFVHWLRRRRAV